MPLEKGLPETMGSTFIEKREAKNKPLPTYLTRLSLQDRGNLFSGSYSGL